MKDALILKRLAKLTHKTWELFIINRIVHKLDDFSIEFVCQQYVRTDKGARLTDLYFPQFGLHVEIDEGQHAGEDAQYRDLLRSEDIIATTGDHVIERILTFDEDGVTRRLEDIARDADRIVEMVRQKKEAAVAARSFQAWDLSRLKDATPHRTRGHIDVADTVVFSHTNTALECFGFSGTGWRKAIWPLKGRHGWGVWFPRLCPHQDWNNRLIDKGRVIEVERASGEPLNSNSPDLYSTRFPTRIVFAREKDDLGSTLYHFIGVFDVDTALSTGRKEVLRLVSTRVDTAPLTTERPYNPHDKFGGTLDMDFSKKVMEKIKDGTLKLSP